MRTPGIGCFAAGVVLALLLGAGFPAPADAGAVDRGRLALLTREAADVLAPKPEPSAGPAVAAGLSALLAALVGMWVGSRARPGRSPAPAREWSFRFPGPVRVDGEMLARMTGAMTPAPAFAGADVAPAAEPVAFRHDAGVPARVAWSPAGEPANAPAPEPAPRGPRRLAASSALACPASTRTAQYASARRLLREGLDRETVRQRTGLKSAEIDLLRCAPGDPS